MAREMLLLVAGILLWLPGAQSQHVSQPTPPEEHVETVEGVVGGDVDVPCSVFPNDEKDKVNLILWYKDHNEVPIFSYDTRRAMFPKEIHHLKDGGLRGRVVFTPSVRPPRPHTLKIKGLQAGDAGRYTCRVDFLNAQSTTRTAEVTAITPVDSVVISDPMGHPVPPKMSPIAEGGTLNLTCVARGGIPRPKVSWWLGEAMVDDSYHEVSGSVLRNSLVISPVTRAHNHAVLSCRASASSVSVTSATVTIDMYLKPLSVTITGGPQRGVPAGQHVDLVCKARGSRPPPIIKWTLGGREIQTDEPAQKGGVTVMGVESHLRLTVKRRDHGARVACRALNPAMPLSELTDQITLNVTYPPEVELRMGASLDGTKVKENTDLYLTCHYDANPAPHRLHFQHEGRPVVAGSSPSVVISGPNLVLRGVTRAQAGLYSCNATNAVGNGRSSQINITVLYSPVCAGADDVWAEPGKSVLAKCTVQAQPVTPITFSWVWTTPTTSSRVQSAHISSTGLSSKVDFTTQRENSSLPAPGKVLGSLECWAENPVGKQAEPCIIKVRRPTLPDAPANCTLSGSLLHTVTVVCDPGASILPQTYRLQVFQAETRKVFLNISRATPKFEVRDLEPGFDYVIYVSAHTAYGNSPYKKVEGLPVKTAENKMSVGESFLVDSEWFSLVVYGGGGLGIVLFVLLFACLIRMRMRRSQHKCTVRKVKGAAIPEEAGQPQPSAVRSRSSESQSLSSMEKKSPNVDATSDILGPGKELGRNESRKYDESPNTLQPIIRQGGGKRQPIIKENGRAEPVRGTQSRQVLFLEPPSAHGNEIPSLRRNDMMIPSRDLESPSYGHTDLLPRPLDPTMRRCDSLSRHTEIPLRHSDLSMRRSDLPPFRHVDVADRHEMPDLSDHSRLELQARHDMLPRHELTPRHDMPPRHDLGPRHDIIQRHDIPLRHEYPSRHELAPRHSDPSRHDISARHIDYDMSPYSRRRLCSDSIKIPSSSLDNSLYPLPVRNTSYHESLRNFSDRYNERDGHKEIGVPPFLSSSSNTLSRESGYCSPRPPNGVFGSSAYRRHARSVDDSSPHPPLTSIMKKSPSVSASVGRYPDSIARASGSYPAYRSLPRPGKSRPPDLEDLNRYKALDRRFDLPFTGSLPRPEPRRPIGGSRLRFADAKYFHVYPDKEKKQNRVVVDDADENFV